MLIISIPDTSGSGSIPRKLLFTQENRCEPARDFLLAGASQSQNQGILRQIGLFAAEVFHLFLVLVSQVVKPKAVLLRVHDGHQLGLQTSALAWVQQALEHRILHPLTVIHAFFRNLPQTLPSGGVLRVHIVSNQNQHSITSIKKAGKPPNRPGYTGPAARPVHRESCPSSFFHPDRDGSGCPVSAPARLSGIFCGPHR